MKQYKVTQEASDRSLSQFSCSWIMQRFPQDTSEWYKQEYHREEKTKRTLSVLSSIQVVWSLITAKLLHLALCRGLSQCSFSRSLYIHISPSLFSICTSFTVQIQDWGLKGGGTSGLSPGAFLMDVIVLRTWETTCKTDCNGDELRNKQWNYFNVCSENKSVTFNCQKMN